MQKSSMTSYVRAIGIAVWLCGAVFWPQMSQADEVRERHLTVEEDDDGYEVRDEETREGDKGHREKVTKEHVETNEDGDVVRHREERIEHEDEDD